LDSLSYRVGTYANFMATMQMDLGSAALPALKGLRTRELDDPSMALLDAWAIGADVISFYQERIVNEGYLRTATERCSVLQLGRLVDYRLRPGVSASVYLAYTINSNSPPVTIPAGAKAQSIPAPGEQMQTFETAVPLEARSEWNAVLPRLTRPQDIQAKQVTTLGDLWIEGIDKRLKAGDRLLFLFGDLTTGEQAIRVIQSVDVQSSSGRTKVELQPLDPATVKIIDAASTALAALAAYTTASSYAQWVSLITQVRQALLFGGDNRGSYDNLVGSFSDGTPASLPPTDAFEQAVKAAFGQVSDDGVPPLVPFGTLLAALMLQPTVPPASSLLLQRSPAAALSLASDARPQLLLRFESRLSPIFYGAWSSVPRSDPSPGFSGVYVLRTSACLFGYNAVNRIWLNPSSATDWPLAGQDTIKDVLQLDNAYDTIAPDSYLVVQPQEGSNTGIAPFVAKVRSARIHPRSDYAMSSKSTEVGLVNNSGKPLWDISTQSDISVLRGTQIFAQSELLTLAKVPIDDVVGKVDPPDPPSVLGDNANRLTLDSIVDGFKAGRWVIVTGQRADVPGTNPVTAAELVMVSGVEQGANANLAGDTVHSTLVFAKDGLAYRYKRNTVSIFANVARATHGETRKEVLGNGNGATAMPTFALKQSPLTYVSAPTIDGVESTLKVVVNGMEWHEIRNLAFAGASDRSFVTATDDSGKTSVTFGDGVHGARVPTGIENIVATYRNGIGAPGNVRANQVSLLATKPLGVKDVINPLAATGGADPETRDQARRNVPLAVLALDRLVSVEDYADFARTFGGVGKAMSVKLGSQVWVTMAGAGDVPIDETSDVYRNLLQSLQRYGDPSLMVGLNVRQLIALTLSAKVGLQPDFTWAAIEPQLRSTLLCRFGFERQQLAQSVYLSEVIACMQGVRGVAWVDVDAFGSLDETAVRVGLGDDGKQDDVRGSVLMGSTANVAPVAIGGPVAVNSSVPVLATRYDLHGVLQPAQIAYFLPGVPDTLLLQEATP